MHFRFYSTFILSISFLVLIFSCNSEDNSSSLAEKDKSLVSSKYGHFKRYHHKKGKYNLLVPEGWKIDKKKKEGCAFISTKENSTDRFKEFLDVYIKEGKFIQGDDGMIAENLSSEDWLDNHINVLRDSDKSIEISSSGLVSLNGNKAPYKSFLKEKNGITYETTVYLLSQDNRAYIVTSILDISKKTFYAPRFRKMIESINF